MNSIHGVLADWCERFWPILHTVSSVFFGVVTYLRSRSIFIKCMQCAIISSTVYIQMFFKMISVLHFNYHPTPEDSLFIPRFPQVSIFIKKTSVPMHTFQVIHILTYSHHIALKSSLHNPL